MQPSRRAEQAQVARAAPSSPLDLEALAVKPATRQLYLAAVVQVQHYHRLSRAALFSLRPSAVDDLLVGFLNHQASSGGSYHTGVNAVFGVAHLAPSLRAHLPRARQCLKAWHKLREQRSHPPITWELAVLLAVSMSRQGWHAEAVATLLAFDCYLRISEFVQLCGADVARESDPRLGSAQTAMALRLARTKTGLNKFVVLRDPQVARVFSSYLSFTRPAASERVFPFSAHRYRTGLRYACAALGVSGWRITPHSLRHGGASRDFLAGASIEQIRHRGRWASAASAERYVQSAPALLLQFNMPAQLRDLAAALLPSLSDVLAHLLESVQWYQYRSGSRVRFAPASSASATRITVTPAARWE
jgi:integrase